MQLRGKKILLGVTGSIAAYKSLLVVRLLKKQGAELKVIMTSAAMDFVGSLSFSTLSENEVFHSFYNRATGAWYNHVELGLWADVFLIAPASAQTLASAASGKAHNLLLTTYLSSRAPVIWAPAMDLDMWLHSSTSENLKTLTKRGDLIIEPNSGSLASGLEGKGRMAEPEQLLRHLQYFLSDKKDLSGKKALITAGPTREKIDPVRFISNFSTGKMGLALAAALKERGAEVILVLGPGINTENYLFDKVIRVESALEMHEACKKYIDSCEIAIFAAAVADYRAADIKSSKIKKQESNHLELVQNPDIAADLGSRKRKDQFFMGFALETDNGLEYASEKLKKKNLDAIALNNPKEEGAGFGVDTNRITLITKDNKSINFELNTKEVIAQKLVQYIAENAV